MVEKARSKSDALWSHKYNIYQPDPITCVQDA